MLFVLLMNDLVLAKEVLLSSFPEYEKRMEILAFYREKRIVSLNLLMAFLLRTYGYI